MRTSFPMVLNSSEWSDPTLAPGLDVDPCANYTYTEAWEWLSSAQPAYLALVSVLGILGNGLVLCVFCLQRKPCTVPDIYLGNLAAADLVMVACLPFWAVTVARGYDWAFGGLLCKLVSLAISMNYYCSVLFLVLVGVDRYLALVRPLRPSRLRRPAWAKRICLGVWALGFLLCLPVLLFRSVRYVPDPGVDACILAYPHPGWGVQYNVTTNVLGFLVPVPVVGFCSQRIVRELRRGRGGLLPKARTERRATHLVLAVLATFLLCWTPHQVARFLDTLDYFQVTPWCLWGHILDIGIQLSAYLGYGNSAINPFLYVIVGKHFRKRAKGVFRHVLSTSLKDSASLSVNYTSVGTYNENQRASCELLSQKKTVRL